MLDLFEQRHPWLAARLRNPRLFLREVEVLGVGISYPGSVSGPVREPDEEVLHGHEDCVEGCLAQRRASFDVYLLGNVLLETDRLLNVERREAALAVIRVEPIDRGGRLVDGGLAQPPRLFEIG